MSSRVKTCAKCSHATKVDFALDIRSRWKHLMERDATNNEPERKCSHCAVNSDSKSLLGEHSQTRANRDLVQCSFDNFCGFQCRRCRIITNSAVVHIRHIKGPEKCAPISAAARVPGANEAGFFLCEHCPLKTKHRRNLRLHILIKHTDKEDILWFRCEQCSYQSKIKPLLKSHVLNNHTKAEDIKWIKCEVCSFRTKRKRDMQRHAVNKHTRNHDIKWFSCEQCAKRFKLKDLLNRHIVRKHNVKKDTNIVWFPCEQCAYRTKDRWQLKKHALHKHTATVDIKWERCEFCLFPFKSKLYLRRHILRRHGDLENARAYLQRS